MYCLNTFKIENICLHKLSSILFKVKAIMGHIVNHSIFRRYDSLAQGQFGLK